MKLSLLKPQSGLGRNRKGEVLVTLMMFVLVAMTIITSVITTVIANTRSSSIVQNGSNVYYIAESGVENALLRLLRDPNYSGEILQVGDGTATITVTGTTTKTINVEGQQGNLVRKIQTTIDYNNNEIQIISWQEIP